jgi:hypothetical protein
MLCVLCYHVKLASKGPLGPHAVAIVLRSSINCFILSAKYQGWENDPWKIDDSFPHTDVHLKRAWVLILREFLQVR